MLDALHDSPIRLISCRHEAAAANMAEAYGKLTGRPGICFVTRGPGATHASVGVHTADQDSTPLILFVGQVPRGHTGRDAFQELDYSAVFGSTAKWAAQVDDAARIPEHVARAFAVATAGRPGPVVLALPEDVLDEETDAADAAPTEVPRPGPGDEELRRLGELLAAAERPLVVVGEGGWSAQAGEDTVFFCEANAIPVVASFRCQDYVDNGSSAYAGPLTIGMDPALARRVEEADLIVALGGRLGDVTTRGYTLLDVPRPRQTLVHVHPDPGELGRVYETDLPIVSDLTELAAGLRRLAAERGPALERLGRGRARRLPRQPRGAAAARRARSRRRDGVPTAPPAAPTPCSRAAPGTSRSGRTASTSSRSTRRSSRRARARWATASRPRSRRRRCFPDRLVVCLAGDGDFMMASSELATAVQYDLPVIVLVVDNGMYGTIRMHQERLFPGRVSGTDLANPDFTAFAQSFGCFGETVERTEDVEPAFERAVASGLPAVVTLRVDPEAISPRWTISELREGAA